MARGPAPPATRRARAPVVQWGQFDGPAVVLDDGLRVDQTESDAVPLGRHERIEETTGDLRSDAFAVVAQVDDDTPSISREYPCDAQPAAVGHGVRGIDDEIEQRLPKTLDVEEHWRQVWIHPRFDENLPVRHLRVQVPQQFVNHLVQARPLQFQCPRTRELEQAAHNRLHLIDVVQHGPEQRLVLAVLFEPRSQQLRLHLD